MTSTLAIVHSAQHAELAAAAGFDRIAVATDAAAILTGASSIRLSAAPTGILVSGVTGRHADPAVLAQQVLGSGARAIWVPFNQGGRNVCAAAVAAGLSTIGIITPEQTPDDELCRDAVALRLAGLLMRTIDEGERLIDRMGIAALEAAVTRCRAHALPLALAGGMEPADVPRLLAIGPDEIGFERALHDPTGRFDPGAAQAIRSLVREGAPPVSARAGVPRPDRIFVRDWLVAMQIGVYAREHGIVQQVRFNVEAEVVPNGRPGLAGIVSYDLITDAIARLAAEHVDLVEDLAERLSAMVLRHPQVASVDITVEKLDVGPGTVGCRIVRARDHRAAG